MRALITILLFSFSFLFSIDYYVETTGTDNASCSVSNPCEHIQTAIDLTSDGDMVIVSGGTYFENLLIETGITLKSADQDNPAIIDGSAPETNPALWNGGSCIVIRTPRGASSRVTATVEDVHLTGGKGTVIIEDTNHDGDFDDPEDEIKIVGGGMIIHNAGLLSRGNKIMNNGDSSTKEGGAVYAAGTGADIPDDQPADPPDYNLPNERSVIVFEGTTFSGNDAQTGHTVMVNGWDPDTSQFLDMDFGNSHFDCIFDSDNNELDGVSEYWVKGKDNTSFDFSGGITSEIPAIINDVWVDPANGVNEGNIIGDINNPFLTIDYAMSMIYPTEDNPITIHLTAGEFSPSINNEVVPIIMSSNINLIGQGEDVTIIDAEQTQRVITMYGCENNIISDLAITGGDALDVDEEGLGGGMFIEFSNPTLTHVIIAENIAKYGGGMSLYTSNPTLTHVAINGNTANRSGGGMHLEYSDPTLTHVTITDNTTAVNGDGGGMRLKYSDPTLTNVTILNNTAKNGGGMSLENSDPTLTYVNISGNTAGYDYLEGNGGGMFIEFSNPTLTHVTINGNSAGDGGGGIYIEDGEPILTHMTIANNTAHHGGGMYLSRSDPTITHVTIAYNTAYYGGGMVSDDVYSTFTHVTIWGNIANYGGGMFIKHSNPTLIHMTIANNMATSNGGGIILDIIEFDPSPTITNSIIWGNTTEIWGNNSEQIYFWDDVQPAPTITYSDIGGGFEGEGNIDDDPLFNDNFTLQDGSPCIDTGTADLDGDGYDDITDYYGQAPDMGAFEFEGSSLTGDLNGDGLLNILDVVILVNIVLGYGDPLPSGDLNGDGVLNVLDVVVLVNIILQG